MVKKMKIFGNNKISLTLIKNLKSQNQTKYINVMYFHICRLVKDRKLAIE